MKQSIKFQRVSLFRRICSIIFDGIIAASLFVLIFAFASQPIVSNSTDYDQVYEKYNNKLVESSLYVYYEENQAVSIISSNYDESLNKFCVYLEENDVKVYYKEDEKPFNFERYYQLKYEVSNINPEYEGEPLFIYNEESDSFIDNVYEMDSNNNLTSVVDTTKSSNVRSFYQGIVDDLSSDLLEQEEILGYTQKLTAYTMLMFFIAIIPSVIILYLIVPLITHDGTTIGKKMLQMRVINAKNGKNASKMQLLIRFTFFALINVVLGIFTYGLSIIISIFMMFAYKTRQTIHDVIAGTIVVRNQFGEQEKVSDSEIITIVFDDGIEDISLKDKGE